MRTRPNIVLVHGAFADGSSWSAVIKRLQAAGYHVTAPQFPLTALADDVARGCCTAYIAIALTGSTSAAGSHLGVLSSSRVVAILRSEAAPGYPHHDCTLRAGQECGQVTDTVMPVPRAAAAQHRDSNGYGPQSAEAVIVPNGGPGPGLRPATDCREAPGWVTGALMPMPPVLAR